jgi:hypothetical protein
VNLKIHFHLVLRLILGIRISAPTGSRHCVVLSTGAGTSSSNSCQHGRKAALGVGGERRVIELSINIYQSTRRNIPED